MSSNRLVNDTNNTQLKQARNCVNPDLSKNLNVHIKTRSFDDPCFVDVRTRQSAGPGRYSVANNFHCECKIPDVVRVATNVPQMTFRDGYGVAGCVIDDSHPFIGRYRESWWECKQCRNIILPCMAKNLPKRTEFVLNNRG